MNCEQCRDFLVEYLYEELDDHQRKQLESALRDCPECQAELQALKLTMQAYRHLPEVEVPARVHQNILREARLHADVLKAASSPWYAGWLIPGLSLGAAAAAVMIGLRIFGSAQAPSLDVSPMDETALDSQATVPAPVPNEPGPEQVNPQRLSNAEAVQAPSMEGAAVEQVDQLAGLMEEEAEETDTLRDEQRLMDNVSPPPAELRQRAAGGATSETRAGDADDTLSRRGVSSGQGLGGLDIPQQEPLEQAGRAGAGRMDPASGAAPGDSAGAAAAPASQEPSPMPAPAPAPTAAPMPAAAPDAMAAGDSIGTAMSPPQAAGMAAPSAASAVPAPGQAAPAYGEQDWSRPSGLVGSSGEGMSPFSDAIVATESAPDSDEAANRQDRERRNRPTRDREAAQAAPASPTEDARTSFAQNLDSVVSEPVSTTAGEREQAEAEAAPQPVDLPSLITLVERGQYRATLDDFQGLVATQPSALAYYWYIRAALGVGQRNLAQRLLDVMRRDYPTDALTPRAEQLVVPPPASAPPASDE